MAVENRVVKMEFDNKQFEANVKTSMKTLNELEKQLDSGFDAKAFEAINTASKNVDLSPIIDSLDKLNSRFTVVGTATRKIVEGLVDLAANAGKSIYNATIGQIKSGGMTRAMNIAQAKFQLEGLKIAWDDVSDSINYAVDGTAYGLDSAAKAASQLAASGVNLGQDMSNALRGISGVAAMTNSEYDDIASIFTKVAGNGRLMTDQLNQLGIRGINAAAEVAKALNITETELRAMVTKGQIDFNTFAKAMDDAFGEHAKDANKTFTGAMSNVKAALSRIGALFATPYIDHMVQVFNSLRTAINGVKTELEPVGAQFDKFFGIFTKKVSEVIESSQMAQILKNILESLEGVGLNLAYAFTTVSKAFKDVFPVNFLDLFVKLTGKINDLTNRVWLSNNAWNVLYSLFRGFFEVIKTVVTVVVNLGDALSPLIPVLAQIGDTVLGLISIWDKFVIAILDWVNTSGLIETACQVIKVVIGTLADYIPDILFSLVSLVGRGVAKLIEYATNLGSVLKNISAQDIKVTAINTLEGVMETFKNVLKNGFTAIHQFINEFSFPSFQGIIDGMAYALTSLSDVFVHFLENLGSLGSGVSSVGDFIADKLNGLKNTIASFIEFLANHIDIQAIVRTGFILVLSRLVFEVSNTIKYFNNTMGSLKSIFDNFAGLFKTLEKNVKYDSAVKIATAVAIITASLVSLSQVDTKSLGAAIGAMTIIFAELLIVMGIMNAFANASEKFAQKKAIKKVGDTTAEQIKGVGESVTGTVNSVKEGLTGVLSSFKAALTDGVKGVGQALQDTIKSFASAVKVPALLISIGASLLLMATAIAKLASIPYNDLVNGLEAIGVTLLGLTVACIALNFLAKDISKSAKGLIAFAASIYILVTAIDKVSNFEWDQLKKGLTGVGLALVGLTVAIIAISRLTKDVKKIASLSLTFISFAAAILILVPAMAAFSLIGWQGVVLGAGVMIVFATALGLLAAKTEAMNAIGVAAALLLFAAAIVVLTPALAALGLVAPLVIAGIIELVVILGIFAAAVVLCTNLAPGVVLLSSAMLSFGTAILEVGVGLALLNASFLLLAVGIAAVVTAVNLFGAALAGSLAVLIQAVAYAISSSYKAITEAVETIIKASLNALINNTTNFGMAVAGIIYGILSILAKFAGPIATAVAVISISVLDVLDKYADPIAEKALSVIGKILAGIIAGIPELLAAIIDGLKRAVASIKEHQSDFHDAGGVIIGAIRRGVVASSGDFNEGFLGVVLSALQFINPTIVNKAGEAGLNFVKGFLNPIENGKDDAKAAGESFGDAACDGLSEGIEEGSPSKKSEKSAGNLILGFVNEIFGRLGEVKDAGFKLGDFSIEGIKEAIDSKLATLDISSGFFNIFDKAGASAERAVIPHFKNIRDLADNIFNAIAGGANDIFAQLDTVRTYVSQMNVFSQEVRDDLHADEDILTRLKNEAKESHFSPFMAELKAKSTLEKYSDILDNVTKSTIDTTKATDLLDNALSGVGGGGGSGGSAKEAEKEIKKLFDTMTDGSSVIKNFEKQYGSAFSNIATSTTFNFDKFQNGIGQSNEKYQAILKTMVDASKEQFGDFEKISAIRLGEVEGNIDELTANLTKNGTVIQNSFSELGEKIKLDTVTYAIKSLATSVFETSDAYTDELKKMDKNSDEYLAAMKESWDDYAKSLKEALKIDVLSGYTFNFSGNLNDMTKNVVKSQKAMAEYDSVVKTLSLRFAANNWDPSILKRFTDQGIESMDAMVSMVKANNMELQYFIDSTKWAEDQNKALAESVMTNLGLAFGSYSTTLGHATEDNEAFVLGMEMLEESTNAVATIIKLRYNEMYDVMEDTLRGAMDLMKEYQYEEEEIDGSTMLENLRSNNAGITSLGELWRQAIGKGLSDTIIQDWAQLGEGARKYLKGFIGMTQEMGQEYIDMYEKVYALPSQVADSIANTYSSAARGALQQFAANIIPTGANAEATALGTTSAKALTDSVRATQTAGKTFVDGFSGAIKANSVTATNQATTLGNDTKSALEKAVPEGNFAKAGKQVVQGFANGIRSNADLVTSAVNYVNKKAQSAFESSGGPGWDMHSPSKVTWMYGKWIDKGLGNGIMDNAYEVLDSTEDLGESMKKTMEYAIGIINDLIEGEMQYDPTIRPVVDLTDFNESTDYIHGVLSQSSSLGLARSALRGTMNTGYQGFGGSTTNTQSVNINVYGTEAQSPREIAYEVQKIINHQTRRLGAIG